MGELVKVSTLTLNNFKEIKIVRGRICLGVTIICRITNRIST